MSVFPVLHLEPFSVQLYYILGHLYFLSSILITTVLYFRMSVFLVLDLEPFSVQLYYIAGCLYFLSSTLNALLYNCTTFQDVCISCPPSWALFRTTLLHFRMSVFPVLHPEPLVVQPDERQVQGGIQVNLLRLEVRDRTGWFISNWFRFKTSILFVIHTFMTGLARASMTWLKNINSKNSHNILPQTSYILV